jgi:uncharacterized protein involved in outer membrane biogenesis
MRIGIRRILASKLFLVPVGVLLLYTLVGFVLIPAVIGWYVPKYARDQLKCQASVGKIRLNPYKLRFEMNDFGLTGPDGGPLVGFARLYLDCELTGFFHWAVHFKKIQLEKPSINLVVETDGSLNFAALAPKPTEEKPKTSQSRPLGLILGTVAIADGEVTVMDRRQVTPAVLSFQDLDLELRALTTLVEKDGTYSLEAGTREGETIAWQGRLSLAPFHSNGKIAFSGIRTASLWEFMQNIVNLEEPQGKLTISTDYQLSAARTPLHLALENLRVDLSGVALKLTGSEAPFFELNKFEIDSARFDLDSRALHINQFLVDGGALHVGIDEAGRNNLEQVLRSKPVAEAKETPPAVPEAGAQPAAAEGPPWAINIENFNIKNFAFSLEDVSRSLPLAAGVMGISMHSKATIEVGAKALVTIKELTTELEGVHWGVKEAHRPLFAAQRFFLEGGEINLGARTLSVARLGLSDGHIDVAVDQHGKINWERLAAARTKAAAHTATQTFLDSEDAGSSPEAAAHPMPEHRDRESTATEQPVKEPVPTEKSATAPPAPADETPWKVSIGAVDIKDIAFGLDDLSRSSPVAAGIAGISIDLKASIEAGRKTQVTVKDIATELKGLHLGVKGASKPLFAAQRLVLEGGDVDLGAKSLTIARINLSDGHLDVGRNRDGKINWEQLFAGKGDTSEQAPPKPASGQPSPWKFLLKSLELDNFRSEVMDQTAFAEKPLYQLKEFQVRVSEIDGKSPMNFAVGFGLEQGGKVALRGKVDPASPSLEVSVNLAGVVLTPVQPYLEPLITLTLDSAAVSTDGVFRYGQPGGGPKLSYEGSIWIDKLSLNQPGSKETYLGWGAMQIPQIKLAIEPNRLQIDEIKLSKPVGQLIIAEDKTVNLAKIVKEQPPASATQAPPKPQPKAAAAKSSARPAAQPAASADPFPFNIGKVKIEDGNMVFADLSLKPKFMTRIHALKGTVGKLSSEKKTMTDVQLDGRVDQYGMAKISGGLDINDFKRSTDISLVFRNVEMASMSPYSGKFAGRRIKSGKLSLDLKYRIETMRLVGDNKIIVDNLVLGEKVDSPDAVNLPLDLAIALLADANGRIDLGLPVSGELNDPQFSIGPIIWKAFVNVITKAVTAPFRALGSLLGEGAEKFDAVEFDPGKAELLPPEKEKLKKLADALQKKPQLKLVVQGQFSPEIDGLELKQLNLSRAVATRMGVQPKPDEDLGPLDLGDSKVKGALEKLFEERFGAKAFTDLEQAVKRGEIKPQTTEDDAGVDKKTKKKRKGFARLWRSTKLYKIVPGAMSPEQSDVLAGELFARLVESDPNPDEALAKLAGDRAQAIAAELQSANAIPAERINTAEAQAVADEAGVSAKLNLDVVPTGG